MNAIKRKVSLFLAGLMVAGVAAAVPASAEGQELSKPLVFTDHRVIVEGDSQEVFVSTNFDGAVEYKLWYRNNEGDWTQGEWVKAESGKVATKLTASEDVNFTAGENYVSVWVKRADVAEEDLNKPNTEKDYEVFNYQRFNVQKEAEVHVTGDIQREIDGLKYTVTGIEGLAEEGMEYRVFAYDYQNNRWIGDGTHHEMYEGNEYQEGNFEFVLPAEGTYLMDVYARRAGSEAKYEAIKLELVDFSTVAGQTVEISTEFEKQMFGANLTVNADSDKVATYRVFATVDGEEMELTSEAVKAGEAVTLFPLEEGQEVRVELFDAEDAKLGDVTVNAGEKATLEIDAEEEETDKEQKEFEVSATFTKQMFGADVKIECEDTDAKYYRVFADVDGEEMELTAEVVEIGEAVTVFPLEKGNEIKVKLFDADKSAIGTASATWTE
jgi:hypothetical protein